MASYDKPPLGKGSPVLGRYTPATAHGEHTRVIQLQRLPVALFLRAREHYDDLVRECTLMAIRRTEDPAAPELPERLGEIVEFLGRRFGARSSRADPGRDAAIEPGDTTIDVTYTVPPSIAGDLTTLAGFIDDADDFCRSELLLTLPRDPAVAAFSHWYTDEFVRQIDGLPPTPWTGPPD